MSDNINICITGNIGKGKSTIRSIIEKALIDNGYKDFSLSIKDNSEIITLRNWTRYPLGSPQS